MPRGVNRPSVRTVARDLGVDLGRDVYALPLHQQPVFAHLNSGDFFPWAEEFGVRHLCLPVWRGMMSDVVEEIIDSRASCRVSKVLRFGPAFR
jgi:dTDP-4-amino-4,6-dideoxygalactose transaminase